jgi:hypothetical protein
MKRHATVTALFLAILILPAGVLTQEPAAPDAGDLLLRIQGPIRVAQGDAASTVVVIGHNADIEGVVRRDLIVVNGTARISGRVEGNITVVNGHLDLLASGRVGQKALLYRSTVTRAAGADVAGGIHQEVGFSMARAAWFFWFGFTVLAVAAGLVFVFLAERSLEGASRLIRRQPGHTVLSAFIVVIGVPLLAFMLILTGIGIPLGIALMVFLLPALAFLGYLVAGTTLGHLALRVWPEGSDNPYLAAAVGLLLLQVVALVPGIGGLIGLLASQLGAGALMYRVWRRKRGRSPTRVQGAGVQQAA